MRIREPGVKWHRRQLYGERDEEAEHEPHLDRGIEPRVRQGEIVEGQGPGLPVMNEIERQDGDEHQKAAALGEEEELDRRVDSPLMPPDRNEEIHREEHQLPEEEEKEEIEREEDTDGPCERPQEVQMEEPHPLGDLAPRGGDGPDAEHQGEEDEQQAQAIEPEMKPDAERRHPGQVEVGDPGSTPGEVERAVVLRPDGQHERKIDRQHDERDPTRRIRTASRGEPGEGSAEQKDEKDPKQHHANTATRMSVAEPNATAAAYQRTRPVSERLSNRYPASLTRASPA